MLFDLDASHLASTFVRLLQMKKAPFQAIVEVGNALEPVISREPLDELSGTIEQMREHLDDQEIFLDANKRFHDVK